MEIKLLDYEEFEEYLFKNLTPAEERIYRILLFYPAGKVNKIIKISQQELAQNAHISIKTVIRSLKKLVEKEFIEIEKQKQVLGHYNSYKLLIIPVFEGSIVF